MPRIMLSYTVHRTRSQHLKDKMGKEFMSLMDISYIQTEMLSIHTTDIYISLHEPLLPQFSSMLCT